MEKADSRSVAAENCLNLKWSIVQFMEWKDYLYLDFKFQFIFGILWLEKFNL